MLLLVLSGRLGAESAPTLEAAIAAAIGRGQVRLVVDLSGVDYVSSAGLTAMQHVAARCAEAQGALAFCGLGEVVSMTVDLAGLASQLPIEPSRDLALSRVAVNGG